MTVSEKPRIGPLLPLPAPAWPGQDHVTLLHYARDIDDWPDTAEAVEVASFNDVAGCQRTYRLVAVLEDGVPRIRFEHVGTGRL